MRSSSKSYFCFAKRMSHSFTNFEDENSAICFILLHSDICSGILNRYIMLLSFFHSLKIQCLSVLHLLTVSLFLQGPITHFPIKGKRKIQCIKILFHRYYYLHTLYHFLRCTGTETQFRYTFPSCAAFVM